MEQFLHPIWLQSAKSTQAVENITHQELWTVSVHVHPWRTVSHVPATASQYTGALEPVLDWQDLKTPLRQPHINVRVSISSQKMRQDWSYLTTAIAEYKGKGKTNSCSWSQCCFSHMTPSQPSHSAMPNLIMGVGSGSVGLAPEQHTIADCYLLLL